MGKRISALYDHDNGVDIATRRLMDMGISSDDISVVTKSDEEAQRGDGAEGMKTGGVIGAASGLVLGFGAFAVPGLGFLAAAGPIASALAGAAAGGLLGSLADFGFAEDESSLYADEIHRGSTFLTVSTDNQSAEEVRQILSDSGAYRVDIR